LLGVLTLLVSAATAQTGAEPTARALGYAALLPAGSQGATSAASGGPGERTSRVTGLRPTGGGSVAGVSVTVSASTAGLTARAGGSVRATGLTLLDGRVSISEIRFSATGGAGPGAPAAAVGDAIVRGVVVDGRPVSVAPGGRVDVPGIGALLFVEQAADGAGGISVNGLRVEVTDGAAAQIIGRPFVLGHLALSAEAGTAPAVTAPPRTTAPATTAPATTAPVEPGGLPTAPAATAAPETAPAPLGLPRRIAPPVTIDGDAAYIFPIVGPSSFSDDYAAPRAGTGWHHGNDIFADRGTPVVAVADGRLSRVGVNTLGGNRLWLTDDAGNAFYYAHLSAYAPAALEGARVTRGQVIAFVGNTGQAITTPPHLHFEVHPGGEENESINPYPYLIAWQRGSDIPKAFAQAATSTSPAPASGAVLVDGSPESDARPPAERGDGLATPAT
jgi:hypothetical protein